MAEKARLCAFLLWQACEPDRAAALIDDAGYGNEDEWLALREGFSRESAVALELIVKAVIAKQLELRCAPPTDRVPPIHDIPQLWGKADLPTLESEDQHRLLLFKSTLMWSGRYATPRTAKAWAEENAAFHTLKAPAEPPGPLKAVKPITCGWEDFDRLYQMAGTRLRALERDGVA